VLLKYSLLQELWQKMWAKIGNKIANQMDYDSLVTDPKVTRYIANFMLQTGLLGQFRDIEPEDSGGNKLPP
jgi:hypothetical protein